MADVDRFPWEETETQPQADGNTVNAFPWESPEGVQAESPELVSGQTPDRNAVYDWFTSAQTEPAIPTLGGKRIFSPDVPSEMAFYSQMDISPAHCL